MKLLIIAFLVLMACTNTFAAGNFQTKYRWRNDNGTEKTATWKAEADKPIIISDRNPIRLRISYINSSVDADTPNLGLVLKYETYETEGPLTKEITADPLSKEAFILVASPHFAHGAATTQQMPSNEFIPGKMISQTDGGKIALLKPGSTEIEWCIKPTKYAKPGTTYYFMADFAPGNMFAVLATSPYLDGRSPDSIVRYSLHPEGKMVTIKWTTALNKHDHFVLQSSEDNAVFRDMATIPGGTGTNFSHTLPLSLSGIVYLRMKLYDEHNKESTSRSIKFDLTTRVKLSAFTARCLNEGGAEIKFNTTNELYNLRNGFSIFKSPDSTADLRKWIFIHNVEGQGWAPNQATSYTYTDKSSATCDMYYAISYLDNNVRKYSRIVKPSPAGQIASNTNRLRFDIYPNPVNSGKVSFDLKGYSGKSFTAKLTSLYGKQISAETFTVTAAENYILKTNASPGTYVLNVSGEGVTKSGKVLVQ